MKAEVRRVIKNYFKPIGDIEEDNMGSLICKKVGKEDAPKIMLAGHMDEVGFMVKAHFFGGLYKVYNFRWLVGSGSSKSEGRNKN